MSAFQDKLNQVISKITSKDFLDSKGLGKDIGFWIFDYPIAVSYTHLDVYKRQR